MIKTKQAEESENTCAYFRILRLVYSEHLLLFISCFAVKTKLLHIKLVFLQALI